MHKALACLLVLAVAGCTSSDGGSDGAAPTASSSSTTTQPPAPAPTTDTLHMLAPPEMAARIPDGSSESRTPTGGSGFAGGSNQEDREDEWRYVLAAPANVSAGEIHLWIEITETLAHSPTVFPGQEPCTWILNLELGADRDADVACLLEPAGPISAGTKELVFAFTAQDAFMLERNETLSVTFDRRAFGPSSTPSVYILSGTVDHDSRVVLAGLKEPIAEP